MKLGFGLPVAVVQPEVCESAAMSGNGNRQRPNEAPLYLILLPCTASQRQQLKTLES